MIPEMILDGGIHYNEIRGPDGSVGMDMIRLHDWDDNQTIWLSEEACIELYKKLHSYIDRHHLKGFL